ncbi:MAG: biotin--[acetyl-CoA-carboxylase] ligase [Butyrivibrio sp.]|nr:biotin--[acetyl-CoA-carboxylase] ligase [Butyrivibrio sp.]
MLSENEIKKYLGTNWAGQKIVYKDVTGSTNTDAALLAKEGALHGTVVIADIQESGRGSRGRSWETPGGENIAMSVVLRPSAPPADISMLTLVMGLSVAEGVDRAISESLPEVAGSDNSNGYQALGDGDDHSIHSAFVPGDDNPSFSNKRNSSGKGRLKSFGRIKWPNDIVIDGKKICGILTELHMKPDNTISDVITGVGINVNMVDFPEEIRNIAGSVLSQTGIRVSRSLVVARCLERFEENYEKYDRTYDLSFLKEQYESRLINLNETVRVLDPGGEFEGRALGITKRGALLVRTLNGEIMEINAGEVSVRGLYGYV